MGDTVIPFDLSITNLIIIAAVAFLAVFYVLILLKLKPSTGKKDQHKKAVLPKKHEPPDSGPVSVNSLKVREKTAIRQWTRNQINPQKIRPPLTETTRPPPASQDNCQEPPERMIISETRSSSVHCVHHFGYLTELPRNTTIPTECLGCSKAVECMTTLTPEKKQVKRHVTKG